MTRARSTSFLQDWLREQSGGAAAEFALVALLLVTFIFGAIDLGRLAWEWNRAASATQAGARAAVVNDIVAADLQAFSGLAEGIGNGQPVPIDLVDPNPVICDSNGCSGYGYDSDAFQRIVDRMRRTHPGIGPENVVIEYRHVGLGFSGNPFGADISPMVTISLRDMVFEFVTPGLSGMAEIPLPPFRTTLPGEDYTTSYGT